MSKIEKQAFRETAVYLTILLLGFWAVIDPTTFFYWLAVAMTITSILVAKCKKRERHEDHS